MTTKNLSVTIGKHTQNGENMSDPHVISVTAPCPKLTTPVLSYTAMMNGFPGTEPAKERKNNLGRPCSFPGCAKMEHEAWFVHTLRDGQQLFYGTEHPIVEFFCPSVRKEVSFESMTNAISQDMISRTPDSDYNYHADTYGYPCSPCSQGSQNAWFGPHHLNMQQQQHYPNPSMQQQSQSLPFAGTFPIGHAVHHQSHMLPIPASQPMRGGNNHQKSSSLSNISTFVQPRAAAPPLPPALPRPTSILRAAAPTTVVSSPLQDAKKTEDDDDGQKSVGSEESDDESFQSNGETGDKSAAAAADAVADSNVPIPIDNDGTKQDMSTNKPDSDGSTNDATLVAALMRSTVKTVNYSTGTSESTDEEQQQQPCIISALKKEKLKGIKANIEKGKFLDIVEVESNTSVTNELTGLTMYHPVCWYFNNSGCRHGVKCMNAHEDRACWKDATWNDVDWLICVNDKEIKRLSADYKKQRDKKGGKKKF